MKCRGYSEKLRPLFKKSVCKRTESVLMGLELEVVFEGEYTRDDFIDERELDILSRKEKDFYLKYDGSLNDDDDYGVEIVFHPRTLKSWYEYKNLPRLLNLIKEYNGRSHDDYKCGLHIHTDYQYLTDGKTDRDSKLEKFIIAGQICNNQYYFIKKISRRKQYNYCDWYNRNKNDLQALFRNNLGHCSRYNFICSTRGTLEWRFFQGTLRYESFISALEFIDFLSRCIKNGNALYNVNIPEVIANSHFQYKYLMQYFKERNVLTN